VNVAGTSYQEPEVRDGLPIKSHLRIIARVEAGVEAMASATTCLPWPPDAKRKLWQRKSARWRQRATECCSALSHRAAIWHFYTSASRTMRVTAVSDSVRPAQQQFRMKIAVQYAN